MDIFECLESLEKGKIEEKDIPKEFFENYDTFNQLIRFNGSYFKYGKEEFKDNKEFLLTALDFQLTYINDDTYCLKHPKLSSWQDHAQTCYRYSDNLLHP